MYKEIYVSNNQQFAVLCPEIQSKKKKIILIF